MDHGGWIKLYRKEIDSAIWEKPPLYHRVWHWLLINADYTTGEWTGTYQGIANGVRWTERNKQITPSIPQIRKIIAFLRSVRSLATGRSGVGSGVILSLTIVNWDTYQNSKQEVGQGLGQGFDHRTVRVGTPPSNYIERVQEVKKLRSKEVLLLSLDDDTPANRFVKAYQTKRPTASHPFANMNASEIEDATTRITDFIDWVGEQTAIELLDTIFSSNRKPVSINQFLFFASKHVEENEKPKEAKNARNINTPKLWAQDILKWEGNATTEIA